MIEKIKTFAFQRFYPSISEEITDLRLKSVSQKESKSEEIGRIEGLLLENKELSAWKREMEEWTPGALEMVNQLVDSTVERLRQTEMVKESCARLLSDAENISSAISKMRDSIHSVASQAKDVAGLAKSSAEKCQTGRQTLEQSSEIMDSLKIRVGEIGKSLYQIERISENTNLLALNAVIEATNAGAAGKGFTVVAHEVKSLARESAGRAEEIKEKTRALREASENLYEAIKGGDNARSVTIMFEELARAARSAADSGQVIAEDTERQLSDTGLIVDHAIRLSETANRIKAAGNDNVREAVALAGQARNILALFNKIDKRLKTAKEMTNAAISGHRSWMVVIRGWLLDPSTVYERSKIAGPDQCAIAKLKAHPAMGNVGFNAVDGLGGPHRKLHTAVDEIAEILLPLKNGKVSLAEREKRLSEAERLYRQVWDLSDAVVAFLRKINSL